MKIFSNLAISLDGKISFSDRSHAPLGTKSDWNEMVRLRKKSDAILFGAATLRTFKKSCGIPGQKKQPYNIILTRSLGGMNTKWPFFKDKKVQKIIIATRSVSEKVKNKFSRYATIIVLPHRNNSGFEAKKIIHELKKFKIRSLLVEGGGGVMWKFVEADLIQEFYITLTPRILGGLNAPTLVDGEGFSQSKVLNLKLHRVTRVRDELYLVYRRGTQRRGLPAQRH